MSNTTNNSAGFVLSIITTMAGSLAGIVSSIVFVLIIYHQLNNRLKRQDRITLILTANIYLCLFLCSIVLIPSNLHTLLGDLYDYHFDTTLCIIHGYFSLVVVCTLYYGFVVQGFYRLSRIVYFTKRSLQVFWFYLLAVPVQFLLSCMLLSPLLFWHQIVYLPNAYFCDVPAPHFVGMAWVTISVYGFPVSCLSLMYLKIIRHVRRQAHAQIAVIRRRQTRDLLVMHRLIILVGILFTLGVPTLTVLGIYYITGYQSPLYHRISCFSVEFSALVLSLLTIVTTPQLKSIVMKNWQPNRVMPLQLSIGQTLQTRP